MASPTTDEAAERDLKRRSTVKRNRNSTNLDSYTAYLEKHPEEVDTILSLPEGSTAAAVRRDTISRRQSVIHHSESANPPSQFLYRADSIGTRLKKGESPFSEAQPNPLGCHPVQKRHTIALIAPSESPVIDLIMSAAATSADAKGKGKATTENDPSLSSTGKDLKGKGKAKLDADVSSVGIEMSNLKLDLNTINMIRDHEKHGGIPREIMGLEHANAPFGFITRDDIKAPINTEKMFPVPPHKITEDAIKLYKGLRAVTHYSIYLQVYENIPGWKVWVRGYGNGIFQHKVFEDYPIRDLLNALMWCPWTTTMEKRCLVYWGRQWAMIQGYAVDNDPLKVLDAAYLEGERNMTAMIHDVQAILKGPVERAAGREVVLHGIGYYAEELAERVAEHRKKQDAAKGRAMGLPEGEMTYTEVAREIVGLPATAPAPVQQSGNVPKAGGRLKGKARAEAKKAAGKK